jgi:hypothetical protein
MRVDGFCGLLKRKQPSLTTKMSAFDNKGTEVVLQVAMGLKGDASASL